MNRLQKGIASLFGIKSSSPKNINYKRKATKQERVAMELLDRLVKGAKDRSRKEIDDWVSAMALADHKDTPRRDYLINLIKHLMTDGHLQGCLIIYLSAILNTEFNIKSKTSGEVD